MEDIVSLRCRIVALETELRHTRDQLINSQNGTLYLVDLVGSTHRVAVSTAQDQELETLRCQLEEAREYIAELKRRLATCQWVDKTLETGEEPQETTLTSVVEEEDIVEDLLGSISGEEGSQEMSKIADEASCNISEKGVRNGWANINHETNNNHMNTPREPEPVFKRVRFLAHEHTRLAGAACYIEDLTDPHDYAEHWIKYANDHYDHTADEWREYYEAHIRPTRVETGTAHPVHMHSYSKHDVKQYDIPTRAQQHPVVDSPLQQDQHQPSKPPTSLQPLPRWPTPEPRPQPHMRSPYANNTNNTRNPHSYLSHEVTHYPLSPNPLLRRTVLITNIPIGLTLSDVFALLPSDRILEAKFAGTAGMKTLPPIMTNAALVEFLDHEDARAYVGVYDGMGGFGVEVLGSATRGLRRVRGD